MLNRILFLTGFLSMLAFLALPASSSPALDYSDFSHIPVLHEGRIKPLDSFARVMLKRMGGDAPSMQGIPAQWLARVLFAPDTVMNEHVFRIHSRELIRMLALPERVDGDFSFGELAASFGERGRVLAALGNRDRKSLTAPEQELTSLYAAVNDFADMVGTFSLLAPLNLDNATRHDFGFPDHAPVTYLNLLKLRKEIEERQQNISARKRDDLKSYTPEETRTVKLATRLMLMEAVDRNNALVRVLPPSWEGTDEWLSPWAVVEKSAGSPEILHLLSEWQALGAAYRQGDAAEWRRLSRQLRAEGARARGVRPFALNLEALYNQYNLLEKALMAYGLGLVAGWLRRSPRIRAGAYGALLVGALLHGTALMMRMAILLRPPVSTLYESMIFVSFVAMASGLWLERERKGADGLVISAVLSCLLLMAANVFAGGDDTLEVLVAVLNTNFWLATHVVCITTGYGTSLVAGTLAHLYLFKRCMGRAGECDALLRRMHQAALVALLFTAVGTGLGGIWADQSWGRFWGWDPKENGALWIVLWLIWGLHGRLAGQLGLLGFAVALALINIVVALAWVGVNLLSVGLHSYGFTDMAAQGLLGFCAAELGYIVITASIAMRRAYSG